VEACEAPSLDEVAKKDTRTRPEAVDENKTCFKPVSAYFVARSLSVGKCGSVESLTAVQGLSLNCLVETKKLPVYTTQL
jgi:hypothetical protein